MDQKRDFLNRHEFINRLIALVTNMSQNRKNSSFTIAGEWGIGKTFVLEQFEKRIEEIVNEETFLDRFLVFHYNCWQYDYYVEPAIAIVSAMLDKAESEVTNKIENTVKSSWKCVKEFLGDVAGSFVENKIGVNLVDVAENVKNGVKKIADDERAFDELFAFKKALNKARISLRKIAESNTVIIVVDELDRCMPEYAIKVLERMHHLFDRLDNIIVIYAIDKEQLKGSIKKIYGEEIEVDKYLKKFIDFTINLDIGNPDKEIYDKYNNLFVKFDVIEQDKQVFKEVVASLFAKSSIDIRSQEKLMDRIAIIHSLITSENVDVSVLLFEVIYLIMRYKVKDIAELENLEWLPNINRILDLELREEIGDEMVDFLKELEEKIGDERVITTGYVRKKINSYGIIEKVFIYFDRVINEKWIYIYSKDLHLDAEINICERFVELESIME